MATCARCCLQIAIRFVNLITSLFAIGMIVYSLWLQKKWNEGVAELPTKLYLPRPWFIYTCLGVGIVVSLSTIFGHMVANYISNSTLCIYIVAICSLVLLEAAVVVAIFFRMDWEELIAKYIDEDYIKFKVFVNFHLKMCQLIAVVILVAQVNVIALAIVLWVIGTEPRTTHRSDPERHIIIQSFLVGPNSPLPDNPRQICGSCENLLLGRNSHESFWSYIKGVFTMRFRRTSVS